MEKIVYDFEFILSFKESESVCIKYLLDYSLNFYYSFKDFFIIKEVINLYLEQLHRITQDIDEKYPGLNLSENLKSVSEIYSEDWIDELLDTNKEKSFFDKHFSESRQIILFFTISCVLFLYLKYKSLL